MPRDVLKLPQKGLNSELRPGLTAAADYLLGTALDFDASADHMQRELTARINAHGRNWVLGITATENEIKMCREKAQLLRGQAGHVLELQK